MPTPEMIEAAARAAFRADVDRPSVVETWEEQPQYTRAAYTLMVTAALCAAEAAAWQPTPTPAELELMMEDTEHHRAGSVNRLTNGILRTYYAGFNLTALAEHISRELNNRHLPPPPTAKG